MTFVLNLIKNLLTSSKVIRGKHRETDRQDRLVIS
jgi:hypothetical protein